MRLISPCLKAGGYKAHLVILQYSGCLAIYNRACAGLDCGNTNAEKRMLVSIRIRILFIPFVADLIHEFLNIIFTGNFHCFSGTNKSSLALWIACIDALLITTSPSCFWKNKILSPDFRPSRQRISTGTVIWPFAEIFGKFIKSLLSILEI